MVLFGKRKWACVCDPFALCDLSSFVSSSSSYHITGGSFAILPHSSTGKAADTMPVVNGHMGAVLDTDFNPFNDHIIASGSEDTKVMVWTIPEGGLARESLSVPTLTLTGHGRKVGGGDDDGEMVTLLMCLPPPNILVQYPLRLAMSSFTLQLKTSLPPLPPISPLKFGILPTERKRWNYADTETSSSPWTGTQTDPYSPPPARIKKYAFLTYVPIKSYKKQADIKASKELV